MRETITKAKFIDISKRLFEGEIVQAQLGDILLDLNKDTLIPHPMELFYIKKSVEIIKENNYKTVADVGTGSGVIAIGIAKELPEIKIYASDIVQSCIDIAKANTKLNKVSNIMFLKNNGEGWLSEFTNERIDMIVSNPPFVPDGKFNSKEYKEMFPYVKYQPETALRTFEKKGTGPFIDILLNSRKFRTRKILYRFDPDYIEQIEYILKENGAFLKRVYDEREILRFIEVDIKL